MPVRSAFIWGTAGPRDLPAVRAVAALLAAIGCEEVYVKAAGDQGVAWIDGVALPAYANPQWSPAWLLPYADKGLKVTPWSYPWPGQPDIAAIVKALQAVWADTVILNPESEWRVQHPASPYNTLVQANRYAETWMQQLQQACYDRFGKIPSFGLSSCPSWADFPYEGFAAECDFFLPEHYFPDHLMAPDGETGDEAGEDMVEAHIRRVGRDKPCIPVVTASREYKDGTVRVYDPDSVIGLAQNALGDLPELDGFSCWEAGNPSFQAEAMRIVYGLLPEPPVEKQDVPPVLQLPYNDSDNPGAWHCSLTDKWVINPAFLDFWAGNGGLPIFGLPITGEVATDGDTRTTQYFERARFEQHEDGEVHLGLVGAELNAVLTAAPKLPKKIAEALGGLQSSSVAPAANAE